MPLQARQHTFIPKVHARHGCHWLRRGVGRSETAVGMRRAIVAKDALGRRCADLRKPDKPWFGVNGEKMG